MLLGRGGIGGVDGVGGDDEPTRARRFAGREGIGGVGPASSSSIFYRLYIVTTAFMLNGRGVVTAVPGFESKERQSTRFNSRDDFDADRRTVVVKSLYCEDVTISVWN